MMKASDLPVKSLMGKKVRTTREFSGIAVGTIGIVVEHYVYRPGHEGVMVEWKTTRGTVVRDGFSRDEKFDETQWLEVVE